MRKVIKNEINIGYLNSIDSLLTSLLEKWLRLMRVMKSVDRQKRCKIDQFRDDLNGLKDDIYKLADKVNPLVPGLDINIPTFL